MKTICFVMLYRPHGSATWTPYHKLPRKEFPAGNFFAKRHLAEQAIKLITANGHNSHLPGPDIIVPTEFQIGRVIVDGKPETPWLISECYVEGPANLNEQYRHGGNLVESREGGSRDLVGDMALAEKRPDVLANDLARMGVTETGDDPADLDLT